MIVTNVFISINENVFCQPTPAEGLRVRHLWSGVCARDECHKGGNDHNLRRLKDARILKECRQKRHGPGDTARIAVTQTVHDGDVGSRNG